MKTLTGVIALMMALLFGASNVFADGPGGSPASGNTTAGGAKGFAADGPGGAPAARKAGGTQIIIEGSRYEVAEACKDKKAGTEVTVDGKKHKCPKVEEKMSPQMQMLNPQPLPPGGGQRQIVPGPPVSPAAKSVKPVSAVQLNPQPLPPAKTDSTPTTFILKMTGKVTQVDVVMNTFTIVAKGQSHTFSAVRLQALPKVKEVVDVEYTDKHTGTGGSPSAIWPVAMSIKLHSPYTAPLEE